ncbi:MAG: glycosyltransferase family 39 protein [Planctomycetota bacterium]|nr:glycosyltransferase family 39 protein [Planctomycetota bacterium]
MNQLSGRAARITLVAILLLGLSIRLAWVFHQSSDVATFSQLPDQREYLELGAHLLHHDGFWLADPRFLQVVYAYRTPGYPFLIRWCDAQPTMIRAVQAALDTSTILSIYLLAKRWLPPHAALLAALLVALDPFLIYFTGLILSETFFTALLCWGIVLLVVSDGPWPKGKLRLTAWLAGGLLLALSVLVRPGAIAIPVALGWAAALVNRHRQPSYRSHWPLPVGATMLLLTAVVLLPWAARNRWVLGSWIWTSTNAGITTYDGFNPDATGASDQSFATAMPWTRDMTEVGRSLYFARLADEWMQEHPLEAIELAFVKIGRTWSPIPLSAEYGRRGLYVAVGICFGIVFYGLTLLGLWQGDLPRPVKQFFLLPALYFTVAAVLSVGSLRYRIPAQPPMAIVAASVCRRRKSIANSAAQMDG